MKYRTLASIAAILISSTVAAERVVNVYNWSDYIDPSVLEKFTQKTGIKVNYDVYSSNFELEKSLKSDASRYDLVMPSNHAFERQRKAGLYQKINREELINFDNLDPVLLKQMEKHDPKNQYSIPYAWGTVGIGYNKDMVEQRLGEQEVNSWDLFFNQDRIAKLQDCGVAVLDSPSEIFSLANQYRGIDPNSEDSGELENSVELLKEIRPYIRSFSSSSYIADLANGDICLVIGFNGDILQSQLLAQEIGRGIEIDYVIPEEGTEMWFDVMAIPEGALNSDEAVEFIDFILQPKIAAAISNYVYYAVPNFAAEPFLDESIVDNKGIYPLPEIKQKLYVQTAKSVNYYRAQNKAWLEVKNSH